MSRLVTEPSRSSKSPRVVSVGCLLYSTFASTALPVVSTMKVTVFAVSSYLVNSGTTFEPKSATEPDGTKVRTAKKSAFASVVRADEIVNLRYEPVAT